MSWRKYLAIPQLIWHGVRAPREQSKAWDRFWRDVRRTGQGGDVLWDAASKAEMDAVLERMRPHVDFGLPLVDIGCGNGRQARELAPLFPRVVGVDLSPHAVEHARRESAGVAGASFQVLDVSRAGAVTALAAELGPANVHVRGVMHVLDEAERLRFVDNLRQLLGGRGLLYLGETNIEGDPLDHLEFQGATLTSMPEPLRRLIASGVRPPSHFGDAQVKAYFPTARWEVIASGKAVAHGVPLHAGVEIEDIPSFFAMVRPRAS